MCVSYTRFWKALRWVLLFLISQEHDIGEGERDGREGDKERDESDTRESDAVQGAGWECVKCNEPNQPDPSLMPTQTVANKVLTFQKRWFELYPWLHYSTGLKAVLCFHCAKLCTDKNNPFKGKADPAFISAGFKNWKKALERFTSHEGSAVHRHAIAMSLQAKSDAMLSSARDKQQPDNRYCFSHVVGSIKYLARQGLAMHGHEADDGNLYQHVKNKAETDTVLQTWLKGDRKTYFSPDIQNEILTMMSHSILRGIGDCIRALPVLQFSLIVDGTQDISGIEQESICLRYVDKDLVPQEVFMGLYQTSDTTGKVLANIALDALTRLNLPLTCLRGQTYDGAANMSGKFNGAQAIIKNLQPLAVHVHCGAHCINLVTQKACSASVLIRDVLDWLNQLGVLFGQSGKFKVLFKNIASSNSDIPCIVIRPLCPTRWTVRDNHSTSIAMRVSLDCTSGNVRGVHKHSFNR